MSQRWPLPQIINRQPQLEDDASLDPGVQVVGFAHRQRRSDCLHVPPYVVTRVQLSMRDGAFGSSALFVCFVVVKQVPIPLS